MPRKKKPKYKKIRKGLGTLIMPVDEINLLINGIFGVKKKKKKKKNKTKKR